MVQGNLGFRFWGASLWVFKPEKHQKGGLHLLQALGLAYGCHLAGIPFQPPSHGRRECSHKTSGAYAIYKARELKISGARGTFPQKP